jgi:hypothetical protein
MVFLYSHLPNKTSGKICFILIQPRVLPPAPHVAAQGAAAFTDS